MTSWSLATDAIKPAHIAYCPLWTFDKLQRFKGHALGRNTLLLTNAILSSWI
jgi:hypothetical protein